MQCIGLCFLFSRPRANGGDLSDSADQNSSVDDTPRPAPPEMFGDLSAALNLEPVDGETYEDENGDPYSVV